LSLAELVSFLDEEKEKLLQRNEEIRDLYRSLTESLRTLTVPFRNSFLAESSINSALNPDSDRITFAQHNLRSSGGEVENNTRWLVSLINNIHAVRNRYLQSPHFIELPDIADVRRLHADVRKFMEELYLQHSVWMLREPNAEGAVLARQKRKDAEELLREQIDPFFERLEQIKIDEYSLRLREQIQEHIVSLESYNKSPVAGEALIREKCSALGLTFDPELTRAVLQELELGDEQLSGRMREKYAAREKEGEPVPSTLRPRYLRIVNRYLARLPDVNRLLPILETLYALYQPRPSLLDRLARLFSLFTGKERKGQRRDVEYSYVIGRHGIEHRRASLEALIAEVSRLQKALSRVKSYLASARASRTLKQVPVSRLRSTIDSARASLRRVFDDGFGLLQWLGKKGNQEKLARVPESTQRDLSACLDSIYATLIINAERLKEVARRFPGQSFPDLSGPV
jgi:hypothetical protein